MRNRMPREGEIVICKVNSINPNSVFAQIEGYDKEGMIHVSEVASRWVRDIREFVREKQIIVCRVTRIDGDHISLSLKRVSREDAKSKLNEFKREKKSEKLLELAAKSLGKTLENAYEEAGDELIEAFGSLTKSFDIAEKNPDMLIKQGVKAEWAKALADVAAKSKVDKVYELKALLELTCYRPDGVDVIKKALSKTNDGFEVKYISAPKYVIVSKGNDRKAMEAELTKVATGILGEVMKNDGSGSFRIVSD